MKNKKTIIIGTLVILSIALSAIASATGIISNLNKNKGEFEYKISIFLDVSRDIDEQTQEVSDLLYDYYLAIGQTYMCVIEIMLGDNTTLYHSVTKENLKPIVKLLEENSYEVSFTKIKPINKKKLFDKPGDTKVQDGELKPLEDVEVVLVS